ncbi:MAG TPA: NrfD/PsrC family molybdoenzyme membrane anchor subunit [Thermoanaerobaculia bacterium]|jgi:formate-dependent nitrite reductase membrane component NrfD|nr:NrfD/PsrC family molybdoenzyme membrane anchor subunit [Thermoanaerobaculia bacterium]
MEEDGRHIAPDLGLLTGEGSQQRIGTAGEAFPSRTFIWRDLPSHSFEEEQPTYYGRPVLKEPVWIWSVPVYFYVGGTAGASAVLAAAAHALGEGELDGLVKSCRRVAAVGGVVGSALLVYDLGRPERFLHMLRVIRPTSAMSLGSWVLAVAASATLGSALLAGRKGFLGRLGDLSGYVAALFGMPLSGYTAVLLGNTAVPVWNATRRSLPHLFIGTSVSGLASLFGLLPVGLEPQERTIVERFGVVGKVVDLAAMAVVEREAGHAEPALKEGVSGALWTAARILTGASLALSLLPGGKRARRVAGGLLGTAGALALRFAVFQAGKASARDPRATFRRQRDSHGEAPESSLDR